MNINKLNMSVMKYLPDSFKCNVFFLLAKQLLTYNSKQLEVFIRSHYGEKCDKKDIKRKMLFYYFLGGVRYSDFFMFRFEEKSLKENMKFVPRSAEMNLVRQVNAKKYRLLLEDKSECYNLFKKYYKRDLTKATKEDIQTRKAVEVVSEFAEKHHRFMIKPISLYCGIGIQIIDSPNSEGIKSLTDSYDDGFVLEELIIQHDIMAQFHPSSVNTIRIVTVNYGDSVEVKWPFMRIGRGNAVVDNAGAGGIMVAIDDNGKTLAAADESRHKYITHPETGLSLIGFEIPKWIVLCDLTKEMAAKCPDCHIMGWDMAYTQNEEWVVIECNYCPNLVSQFSLDRGFKDEFVKVRKRLRARLII